MTISIFAQPIEFSAAISGSMPNINVTADTLAFATRIIGLHTTYPPTPRNPTLDWTFDCLGLGQYEPLNQGVIAFNFEQSGSWLNETIWDDTTLAFALVISGDDVFGNVVSAEILAFDTSIDGEVIIEMAKTSWVKWSKIGYIDFDINESNSAGERPMEWVGSIYDILKHDDQIVIYGGNGISTMKPIGNNWKYKTLSRIGTKGRNAQISNSSYSTHWFIDANGHLYEFGDKIIKFDYSEFLSKMTGPVMSLDETNELLYICDGTYGYVYSYTDKSFGQCSPYITGYGFKDGSAIVTGSDIIVTPDIGFTTDIYDCGTRKEKTIFNIEINTEVTEEMEACIYYRNNHKDSFTQTPWSKFTHRGICYLPCYGIEFMFGFRMITSASIHIDQFKINGVIHGFSFLDTVRKEN